MALTKVSQTPQASATNAAGVTATGAWLATGYGVSGVAQITNGGTPPAAPCNFIIEVADDNTGTNAVEWLRQPGDIIASSVNQFQLTLGIGAGADYPYYRTKFTGNTGQSVTVQANASSTTAI
jgi:hypothetical protein